MNAIDARHLLVKKRTLGVDPLADAVIACLNRPLVDGALGPKPQELELYEKALDISRSDVKRGYVEACMVASQDLKPISDMLGIPLDVLSTYRKFFFDVEGFDKLSMLEVVDKTRDLSERGTKTWALTQGLDFLAWRLGKTVSVNPVSGLQELFTLCMYKSKEALFSGNASESSKEATKWTKMSMDMARLLKVWVMDGDAAKRDIELAIAQVDPTFESFSTLLEKADALDTPVDNIVVGEKIDSVSPTFDGLDSLDNGIE